MPFRYFNSAAFLSSLGLHFARLLASPYLRIHVSFLPPFTPGKVNTAPEGAHTETTNADSLPTGSCCPATLPTHEASATP
jgi:hypothetical protein